MPTYPGYPITSGLTLSQCNAIHRTIVEQFKGAVVYGKSVKHQPQRVGLSHELADEDIGTWNLSSRLSVLMMLTYCLKSRL